ncbi:hypothetical protein SMC58_002789 [Cronobacter dublinensis]|nr:hypothetical protein [Cronobacter dublinensis]
MSTISNEIAQVARAALDYIDALPSDVVARLPTMPGFDRDWAENALRKEREAAVPVGFIHPFTPFTFGKSSGAIFKEATRNYYKPVYAAPPAPPVAVPEWTNEECLEFLSIAFRHAEIKGDFELDDLRLGVKMVNESRAAMLAAPAKPSSLREGINALRELGGIDAEKILADRDALNECEIPEGWKLVPTEPTQEMCDAVLGRACFSFNGDGAKQIYEAMLAAAPGKEG